MTTLQLSGLNSRKPRKCKRFFFGFCMFLSEKLSRSEMTSLSGANSTDSPYKCHCKCQCEGPAVTCVQFPGHLDSVARGSISRDCLKTALSSLRSNLSLDWGFCSYLSDELQRTAEAFERTTEKCFSWIDIATLRELYLENISNCTKWFSLISRVT